MRGESPKGSARTLQVSAGTRRKGGRPIETLDPIERMALRTTVVAARGRLKLTQRQLAQRMPCAPSFVARIEKGGRIEIFDFVRLARAMNLRGSELLSELENQVEADRQKSAEDADTRKLDLASRTVIQGRISAKPT